MEKTLEQLETDRFAWSLKTFANATQISSLIKATEEIKEVSYAIAGKKSNEEIAEEYVDVLMCVFDSAGRGGIYVGDLLKAYALKLEKNKNRTWKENADRTYSHIKGDNI